MKNSIYNYIKKEDLVSFIYECMNEVLSEKEVKSSQIPDEELRMGIKHEMEHTDDPVEAEKTALDHLRKNPRYYSQLNKCGIDERKLSKSDISKREKIVKSLKPKYAEFVQKYGKDKAKEIMYATATKLAQQK